MPPLPEPNAVIVVPDATPVPVTVWPTASVPADTALTVRVVPLIDPVKDAATVLAAEVERAVVVVAGVMSIGVPEELVALSLTPTTLPVE